MPDNAVSPVIATILTVALTVVLAGIVGAVFLGMVPSLGTAKIVAVSAEGGDAASPVFITLLGGNDLAGLSRMYAYDVSGSNFAVTEAGAVFSPGLTLHTIPAGTWNAGLQRVSLTGEFTDGTMQWLWADYLTLPAMAAEEETGEVVWMRSSRPADQWVDGQYVTVRYYPPSVNYYQWSLYPVTSSGAMLSSPVSTVTFYFFPKAYRLFGTDYAANTLAMQYYDENGDPAKLTRSIAPADSSKYNTFTQAAALFAPFGKIKIQVTGGTGLEIGRILSLDDSDQIFKTYVPAA